MFEDIKLIYLFIACFILASLYKVTIYLETLSDEAIKTSEILTAVFVICVYGIFGGLIGLGFYLIFEYELGLKLNSHLEYLGYVASSLIATIGTNGVRILHKYIERKAQ